MLPARHEPVPADLFADPRTLVVPRPGATLLPVMDPGTNLREVAKQMLLLEDHLAQPLRRCPDCIGKHLLTWEAFAEEGLTLDRSGQTAPVFGRLAAGARLCQLALLRGEDPFVVAQWVRGMRKTLLPVVFPWKRPQT